MRATRSVPASQPSEFATQAALSSWCWRGSTSSPDTTVSWKAQAKSAPSAPSANTRPPDRANARPTRNAVAQPRPPARNSAPSELAIGTATGERPVKMRV